MRAASKSAIPAEMAKPAAIARLNEELYASALRELAARDVHLAGVISQFGPPPMWSRDPGFGTLVYIILEQQVSLASARAAYARLQALANPLTPGKLLKLTDAQLKGVGFSRQKMRYARLLAQELVSKKLDLEALLLMEDAAIRARLMELTGIGPWSAEVYLLMALGRADAWPIDDLALAAAVQQVKKLRKRPSPAQLERMAGVWQPWRGVAARIFWHHYLSTPRKRTRKKTR
jgi:DNA-3-methyladenine glycosylase II